MTNPDETKSGETLAVVTALATAAGAVLLAVIVAAVLSIGPARSSGALRPLDPAPGCLEWTDGCVICRRTADGPACSTPGIACTPRAVQCDRRG